MVKNPLLQKWEDKLQGIFDRIDEKLENKYGHMFPLLPNRPEKGKGVTPDTDGLFDLSVSFSVGLVSEFGPGYVFKIRLATMEKVPQDFKEKVEDEVVELLKEELPKEFPGRNLQVSRDGRIYKIHGDLHLN
jgi:hypothetical protein